MIRETDYCDYDTSLMLKELGFKEPTLAYYLPNHPEQLIHNSVNYRGCIIDDCFRSYNSYPSDVMGCEYIDAPTWVDVHRWLREEKEILVGMFVNYTTQEFDYHVATWEEDKYRGNKYQPFDSAFSDGIKSVVKKLKEGTL